MDKAVCCTRCQSVGLRKRIRVGSVRVGLILLALFIVPGVFYFVWYLLEGHWGCSTCGSRRIVPIINPYATRTASGTALNAPVKLA